MATDTDDRRRSPSTYLVERDWRRRKVYKIFCGICYNTLILFLSYFLEKGVEYTTLMDTFTLSNTSAKLILPRLSVADQLTVLEKNVFRASSQPVIRTHPAMITRVQLSLRHTFMREMFEIDVMREQFEKPRLLVLSLKEFRRATF